MSMSRPMLEADWLTSPIPVVLLGFLQGRVSPRKVRLFAVACCRRVEWLMTDERSRMAVDVAERHADGRATQREVRAARAGAKAAAELARSAYLETRSSTTLPYGYGPSYAACNAAAASAAVLNVEATIPASLAAYALAAGKCDFQSKQVADDSVLAARA
jgi:hypothetical protein